MRMKVNQKMAEGASAISRLYDIASKIDGLGVEAYDIVTSAEIVTDAVERLFEQNEASKYIGDDRFSNYYLIPAAERRYLAFQIHDTTTRARSHERPATELSIKLLDLHREMKAAGEPTMNETCSLGDAIAKWQTAYKAWTDTDKGDGNGCTCDTPEALCEQSALHALAQHPCATLDEVRRKADLFQSNPHLSGLAEDFTFDLLRSFAEAGGN